MARIIVVNKLADRLLRMHLSDLVQDSFPFVTLYGDGGGVSGAGEDLKTLLISNDHHHIRLSGYLQTVIYAR